MCGAIAPRPVRPPRKQLHTPVSEGSGLGVVISQLATRAGSKISGAHQSTSLMEIQSPKAGARSTSLFCTLCTTK
eukprot:1280548-Alexandrium_andersonii.AAC.1